jgi:hypothetical protein
MTPYLSVFSITFLRVLYEMNRATRFESKVIRKLRRIENHLSDQVTRKHDERGLYGIDDLNKFRQTNEHEPESQECRLANVSWIIRDDPSEAEDSYEFGENGKLAKLDLSEKVFDGPVFLDLGGKTRTYRVPVFGGTIYDVLSVIFEFYKMYEETHYMGDHVFFEGLHYISPSIWGLSLGS